MNTTKTIAALFDFDGVIMDTETQYTVFWDEQGRKSTRNTFQHFRKLGRKSRQTSMFLRNRCPMNIFPE